MGNPPKRNLLAQTAFLSSLSRARRYDLSHDVYASKWIRDIEATARSRDWQHAMPNVDIEISLRSNFFLGRLLEFIAAFGENIVFVNVGAGFTSYQYLTSAKFLTIEIDLEEVIERKQSRAKVLKRVGELPERDVIYWPCDLNDELKVPALFEQLGYRLSGRKSFFLFEGLFYYLRKQSISELIRRSEACQHFQSWIAFDYWDDSLRNKPILKDMKDLYEGELLFGIESFTFIEPEILLRHSSYTPLLRSDVFTEARRNPNVGVLNEDLTCPEHYVIAEKMRASL